MTVPKTRVFESKTGTSYIKNDIFMYNDNF